MRRFRFSISRLMILVAIAAGIVWLYRSVNEFAFPILLGYAAVILALASGYGRWLRQDRRRAFVIFGVSALASLALFGVLGVTLLGVFGQIIKAYLALLIVPVPLGAGSAWIMGPKGEGSVPLRSRFLAWVLVLGVVATALSMVFSQWPMRVAFLVSRPALDRLADRVEAGESPTWPVQAGLFQVNGLGRGHAGTGNIPLMIGADSNGNTWFVRSAQPSLPLVVPAQVFVSEKLTPDGRWWHQEED